MSRRASPLRYPGGKQVLARVLSRLLDLNDLKGGTYIEPYAGGAGAALALLFGEHVDKIVINDADDRIAAFWNAVISRTERFVELIRSTPTTVEEWGRQRATYLRPARHSELKVGFATFYLNRCNRSGIISNGGPIGGLEQTGKWKIDARFNRDDLEKRVRLIADYGDRIRVHNLDAMEFLKKHAASFEEKERPFVYLDPPYYGKGQDLYLNHYKPADHAAVARFVRRELKHPWVMSYDDAPEIRELYSRLRQVRFSLDYSARERRVGRELLILKPALRFPSAWRDRIPASMMGAGWKYRHLRAAQ